MLYSLVKPRNLLQSLILFKARIWSINQVCIALVTSETYIVNVTVI